MNRHLTHGIIVGALFAVPIAWIAALDAIAEGNALAILSTLVFGLAAGLCIGALIAANFAMLAYEEKTAESTTAHRSVEAHAHAA
jgi:hypothetical protein